MTVVQRDPSTMVVVPDGSKLSEHADSSKRARFDGETITCIDAEGNCWIKSDEWVQVE